MSLSESTCTYFLLLYRLNSPISSSFSFDLLCFFLPSSSSLFASASAPPSSLQPFIHHSFSSFCPSCQLKQPEISLCSLGPSPLFSSHFSRFVSCCGQQRHIWVAPIKISSLQVFQCVSVHVKAGTHCKKSPTNINYMKVQCHVSRDTK